MNPMDRKSNRRVLLALECSAMGNEVQKAALRSCVHLGSQLDILLVSPPDDSAPLPALLLLQLEHSGIDYRLAQVSGQLSEAVIRYLNRNRQAVTLIVADAAGLSTRCREILMAGGHRLLSLAAPLNGEKTTAPASVQALDLPASKLKP